MRSETGDKLVRHVLVVCVGVLALLAVAWPWADTPTAPARRSAQAPAAAGQKASSLPALPVRGEPAAGPTEEEVLAGVEGEGPAASPATGGARPGGRPAGRRPGGVLDLPWRTVAAPERGLLDSASSPDADEEADDAAVAQRLDACLGPASSAR